MACTFLAVIGLRFGDAGLRDLMVESWLVGPSAVSAVLRGKHYNRALRSHKIIFEDFFRLLLPNFEKKLADQSENRFNFTEDDKTALLKTLRMFRDKSLAETLSALMNAEQMEQLQKQLIRFIEQQKSALPKFWLSYMDMVSLLLRFVRASWEGYLG